MSLIGIYGTYKCSGDQIKWCDDWKKSYERVKT